jgi:hypothetical protein
MLQGDEDFRHGGTSHTKTSYAFKNFSFSKWKTDANHMGSNSKVSSPSKRQKFSTKLNYLEQKDISGGVDLEGQAGELTLKPKKWIVWL